MEIKYSNYQSLDDFLEAIADQCLSELDEENKQAIRNEPDAIMLHFGLGSYIRNTYIYPQKAFNNGVDPFPNLWTDDLSLNVTKIIIDKLTK